MSNYAPYNSENNYGLKPNYSSTNNGTYYRPSTVTPSRRNQQYQPRLPQNQFPINRNPNVRHQPQPHMKSPQNQSHNQRYIMQRRQTMETNHDDQRQQYLYKRQRQQELERQQHLIEQRVIHENLSQQRSMQQQAMEQRVMQQRAVRENQHRLQPNPSQSNYKQSSAQNKQENQSILFYSKFCDHSKKFLEGLYKTKLFNSFFRICVDVRNIKLPDFVARVPTIIVYDKNEHRHILSDKSAFEWLNQILDEPIDISCFESGEMGSSLSDTYAFLDGKVQQGRHFAYIDGMDNNPIYTPTEIGDDKSLEGELEKIHQQRSTDVPQQMRAHPNATPDFTRGFEQDGGGSKIGHSEYDRLQSLRQQEDPKGPTPMRAPNFQSTQFKSNLFQSKSGTGYQQIGISAAPNTHTGQSYHQELIQNRNPQDMRYQQAPSNMSSPDFQRMISPMKVI